MRKYVKKLKPAKSLDGSYVTEIGGRDEGEEEPEYENKPQPYIVCLTPQQTQQYCNHFSPYAVETSKDRGLPLPGKNFREYCRRC